MLINHKRLSVVHLHWCKLLNLTKFLPCMWQ